MIFMTLKSMNLDMIQDLWEQDSKIDDDNLHSESTKIPSLHSKYYKLYNNILVLKKSQENKYKILKKKNGNTTLVEQNQKYMQNILLTTKF